MTEKKVKIIFFGTPAIGVQTLRSLFYDERFDLVGVGVFPDKPVGRKKVLTPCAVKIEAQTLGLEIFDISSSKDINNCLEATQADLALVIAFGFLFRLEHLHKLPFGMVNVHFSLLPKYRGASPVQSALLNGDETSGITWQKMVQKLDAGPILAQKEYPIGSTDTTEGLFEAYAQKTAELSGDILWDYVRGKIIPFPQDERGISFCGKFEKEDGALFPEEHTASEMFSRWRAFQPWPGVFLSDSGVKLLRVSLDPKPNSLILCGAQHTKLFVQELQIPGKKPMSSVDAWRGNADFLPEFQKEEIKESPTTKGCFHP